MIEKEYLELDINDVDGNFLMPFVVLKEYGYTIKENGEYGGWGLKG